MFGESRETAGRSGSLWTLHSQGSALEPPTAQAPAERGGGMGWEEADFTKDRIRNA